MATKRKIDWFNAIAILAIGGLLVWAVVTIGPSLWWLP